MIKYDSDLMEAEDWKTMYMILNHTISDAVDQMGCLSKEKVTELLVEGLQRAEQYYITVGEAVTGEESPNLPQGETDILPGIADVN